jgi:hypothetical protein
MFYTEPQLSAAARIDLDVPATDGDTAKAGNGGEHDGLV